MNDTNSLNGLIIETIRDVKGGVGKSVDFLLEQAPDVAEQLLAYKFVEAIIIGSIALIFLLAALWFWRIAFKRKLFDSHKDTDFAHCFTSTIMAIIAIVICPIFMGTSLNKAIKIKVAPKVYLIEYVSTILK